MQSPSQPLVSHSLLSAGVDWITCTAQSGSTRWDMTEYARRERDRLIEAGESIKAGYRLGYYGWQVEGFFHGQRDGSSIIVASGATADRVWRAASNVSDNVARLDLQVTVATPLDRPHLGKQAAEALRGGIPRKVRVKNARLIISQPQGETLCLGRRTSDQYGRLYDKASEAKLGEPRSIWRYEVELKRRAASAAATDLRGSQTPHAVASALVWSWFNARGVVPVYTPDLMFCPQNPPPTAPSRNVLTWFEESLSITVARAVRRYGRERVMQALGLLTQDDVNSERREEDASRSGRPAETDGLL